MGKKERSVLPLLLADPDYLHNKNKTLHLWQLRCEPDAPPDSDSVPFRFLCNSPLSLPAAPDKNLPFFVPATWMLLLPLLKFYPDPVFFPKFLPVFQSVPADLSFLSVSPVPDAGSR